MSSEKQTTYISDYSVLYVLKNFLENITKVSGINNSDTYEIKTNYNKADGETVISGRNNCFIVLGRDRNAGVASGKGGIGATGASAIDLVAGLGGSRPLDKVFAETVQTDKDFKNDSARVYISQMSDVDTYFEIPKLKVKVGSRNIELDSSNDKSAVAAKADHVRVIARENIKLVTFHKGLNSQSKRSSDGGIDIIAGCNAINADKSLNLQPMVKGNNLLELLQEMRNLITDAQSTVSTFMDTQKQINDMLANHVHQNGPPGGVTDGPLIKPTLLNYKLMTVTLPDILQNYISQKTLDGNYFEPTSEKFINSLWNRVN